MAAPAVFAAEPGSDELDLAIGNHEISAHFGYEVEGSRSSTLSIVIYHVPDGAAAEERERLGALLVDGIVIHDRSRHSAFAVSVDGKSLLYMHSQHSFLAGSLKGKAAGLYEYVHGKGDRLIHADTRVTWSIKELPNDAIRFGEGSGKDETYVRTTSGEEYLEGKPGWTPLHRAAYLGEVAVVERLLAAGEELEQRDGFWSTPLHIAVKNGQEEVARVLIEHGANVNAALNPYSRALTPMHSAAALGNSTMVELLLSSGADVDSRASDGSTPLHLAVFYETLVVIANLIDHSADVNAKGDEGNTPLHVFAGDLFRDERSASDWASSNNEAICRLLLSAGADVNARNNESETPLQQAVSARNIRSAQILAANGADASLMELGDFGRRKPMTLQQRMEDILESRWWKAGAPSR